ncbi:hypothetical protein AB0F88_23230 [Streptosporangium sp. NPDC023963]|uniref:hypothetical protein n=1 Tax=Streptosporangium sp. NPDC023963 TaxID=3155608 RepID=UPI00341B7080
MRQEIGTESHQGVKRDAVRRLRLLAAGLGAALPLIASVPAPAGAVATPGEPAPTPANNCVVDVIGGLNEPGTEHCFPTFTEAIRFATDGAVTDAPPSAVEGVDDPVLDALLGSSEKSADAEATPAAAGTLMIIGIEYEHINYRGASYTFRGSRSCTGPTTNIDYSVNLPRHWWDRISSFRNYSNCFTNHYAYTNFLPPATGYLNDRAVMPIINGRNFNDDARSIRWS